MWYYFFVNVQNTPQILSIFSLITLDGAIIGLALTAWLATERKIFYLDAGITVTLGALLGARVGFVLRNWEYFTANAAEISQIWLGGLTWSGALLGGILALIIFSLITKHPLGKLADALLPLMGALAASIWLASWADGAAYGPQVEGWWSVPVRNQFGSVVNRWPIQAFGAILSILAVVGAYTLRGASWSHPGRSALLGMGGISTINLILSLFRVDPAPYMGGIRTESVFALIFSIAIWGIFAVVKGDAKAAKEPEAAEEDSLTATPT